MTRIFIFGPSCSGKSTLAQALEKQLGSRWSRIDRDDLIEQGICHESEADRVLDEKMQRIKDRVIIDSQVPWREKQEGELYFLVLPPLEILLERDAQRAVRLRRSSERAERARQYVIETYDQLRAMPKDRFDGCFDSSCLSLEEEIERVQRVTNETPFH